MILPSVWGATKKSRQTLPPLCKKDKASKVELSEEKQYVKHTYQIMIHQPTLQSDSYLSNEIHFPPIEESAIYPLKLT